MHSTETALINVTDNILKASDEKPASLLLLEMSKAFYSLNHNLFLEKLRKLGLKASEFPYLVATYPVNIKEYDTKIQSPNCYRY